MTLVAVPAPWQKLSTASFAVCRVSSKVGLMAQSLSRLWMGSLGFRPVTCHLSYLVIGCCELLERINIYQQSTHLGFCLARFTMRPIPLASGFQACFFKAYVLPMGYNSHISNLAPTWSDPKSPKSATRANLGRPSRVRRSPSCFCGTRNPVARPSCSG